MEPADAAGEITVADERTNTVERKDEEREVQARRDFLKKAGKLAVAAPALAVILKAEKTHAWGNDVYGGSSYDCNRTYSHDYTRTYDYTRHRR